MSTHLICRFCGGETIREYVPAGALTDARGERDEWIERCRMLVDPHNHGYWAETVAAARKALEKETERLTG